MLNRIYIGSNNKRSIFHPNGKLEYKKAIAIVAKEFEGSTAIKGIGYYKGKKENNLIVEIETNEKSKVKNLIKVLARALNQESIGWAIIGKMNFIGV